MTSLNLLWKSQGCVFDKSPHNQSSHAYQQVTLFLPHGMDP